MTLMKKDVSQMITFLAIIGILIFGVLIQVVGSMQNKNGKYKHFKKTEVHQTLGDFEH
ncbi:hypothetical protein FC80_GL001095 [Liquorilactobacillus cacaonum DSM 21116]|uniref:Uncharacterized protein n=1 Tax=Liquorilactobacillus cacaonum DSM 21116 TaxID=1423729 RepID=A0A0R2CII5_9LACO|nr:hypothetical protein FC80_GL001095 [Liquorilactobacillus cacaonum DSM 21116]